jgi:hypothetical protein
MCSVNVWGAFDYTEHKPVKQLSQVLKINPELYLNGFFIIDSRVNISKRLLQ